MKEIFETEGTDAVLLIDASNAFNRLNRAVAMSNVWITCPEIATYITNTYRKPARLFIAGGKEILSQEGTTQGDPLAMAWYSLSTTTIIEYLNQNVEKVSQVWLADDATGGGKIRNLKEWFTELSCNGKPYGYFVNGSKSWLICKSDEIASLAREVFGDTVNITTEGKRHLGAVLGSENYKDEFCKEKVEEWRKELEVLAEIAETQPQAAFSVYTKGYRSKFTYFLRTIQTLEEHLHPIESVLFDKLVPALFGGESPDVPSELLSLNPKDGGLVIENPKSIASSQYKTSILKTKIHKETIIKQEMTMRKESSDGRTQKEIEQECRKLKENERKVRNERLVVPSHLKRCMEQAKDTGASNWLNALPIKDQQLDMNKGQFADALCIRYNQPIRNLPSTCPCGDSFDVEHALSCKKGGFIAQRHDNLRDIFTNLLSKICKDVEVEPHLMPVTNETFGFRTTNTSPEARLDIKANGFWQRSQTAFFDIRVTHVNSSSQAKKPTAKIFKMHEDSKKREYMQRVIDIEHGTFTPLVFGTNGGMGAECQMFMKQLAATLAEKTGEDYADIVTWIRTRISTEIMKSTITCIRGSRVPFRSKINDSNHEDFSLMNLVAGGR